MSDIRRMALDARDRKLLAMLLMDKIGALSGRPTDFAGPADALSADDMRQMRALLERMSDG